MRSFIVKATGLNFDLVWYGDHRPGPGDIIAALNRRGITDEQIGGCSFTVGEDKRFNFGQGKLPRQRGQYEEDAHQRRQRESLVKLWKASTTPELEAKRRLEEKDREAAKRVRKYLQDRGDPVYFGAQNEEGGLTCAEYALAAAGGAGSGSRDYARYYARARRGVVREFNIVDSHISVSIVGNADSGVNHD